MGLSFRVLVVGRKQTFCICRKTRSTGGEFTTDTEAGGSSRTVENVEESMQEDEIEVRFEDMFIEQNGDILPN